MGCAKAFGALVHMRDDPGNTPIPDEIPLDLYHKNQIEEAKKELIKVKKMTISECKKIAIKEFNKSVKYNKDQIKIKIERKKRYEKILSQAKDYKPPTPEHNNFKAFMISQITDSMVYDCNTKYDEDKLDKGPLTGKQWKAERIDGIDYDIRYHTKEWDIEVKSNKDRNKWLKLLRMSLENIKVDV